MAGVINVNVGSFDAHSVRECVADSSDDRTARVLTRYVIRLDGHHHIRAACVDGPGVLGVYVRVGATTRLARVL